LDNKSFDTFDLPSDLSSPWGLTVDDNSNLWVTNAGTSIFYKLSPGKNDGRSTPSLGDLYLLPEVARKLA